MAYINNNKVLFSAKITGGGSLIEVTTLPTTNIDKTAFYRTPDGIYWYDNGWKEIIDDVSLDTILSGKGYLTQHQDISGKQDKLTFDGTYNASTNKAATVKTVATEVAKMLAGADADFDTLKEMSDWLTEHKDSAATMNSAIADIENDVDMLFSAKEDHDEDIAELKSKTEGLFTAKLDKNTTADRVYAVNSTGGQYMLGYNTESSGDRTLVLRNMSGGITIKDADIKTDTDAVNRKYVKDAVAPKSSLTLAPGEDIGVDVNIENSTQSKDEGELYFNTPNGSSVRLMNIATPKLEKDAVNKKYVDDALANAGGSGGGSATAIIDVDTLPTENINANAFYRVKTEATGFYMLTAEGVNVMDGQPVEVITVETLPATGKPLMVIDYEAGTTTVALYVRTSDSTVHFYVDETVSAMLEAPVGWSDASVMDLPYEIVSSPEEASGEAIAFVETVDYKYPLYVYAVDEWVEVKSDYSDFSALGGSGSCNCVIPTKVSELENDKGYLTSVPAEYITEESLENYGSEGLQYTLNDTDASCSGIGQCTDTDIVISDTICGLPVTTLSDNAFRSCTSLESVTIPDSVTDIGSLAFWSCSNLESVTMPDNAIDLKMDTFTYCHESLYTDYENGRYVGDKDNPYQVLYKLLDETLSTYKIHDKTKIIGYGVFAPCSNLTSIIIPNGVKSISELAFNQSSLKSVTIPDSVELIGGSAFRYCQITSIRIPKGVTAIESFTFQGCASLASVVISKNITKIKIGAFGGCGALTDVYYEGTEEEWAAITIGINNDYLTNATIHYNSEV